LNHKTIILNGHWLWNGAKWGKAQHGCIRVGPKMYSIHRLSAFIHFGFELDSKMQINHKIECNIAHCWNPEHIYIGTQTDNVHDSILKGTYKGFGENGTAWNRTKS
jgi:hypothetical protein